MNHYIEFYTFPAGWSKITILNSTYLKGRIGWQGLKASEFTSEGPYLVTGTDFNNGLIDWDKCYHISEERFKEAPAIHLKENDLLITKDGTIGKVAIVKDCPEKAILNSGIFLLRCKDGSYLHEFLYHILRSNYFKKYLLDTQGGSTIVHLYQREFEKFTFFAPSVGEQGCIANVLSYVDRTIEQTKAVIAKHQRVKIGLMQDLLTKGVDERGNIRSETTHEFKDSPLGRIPKDWSECLLKDIAEVSYGIGDPLDRSLESGINILSLPNVNINGDFVLDYVPKIEPSKVRRFNLLEPGDLLFNWRNGSQEHLGKTAYFDLSGEWTHVGFLLRVRSNRAKCLPRILFYQLTHLRMMGFFLTSKIQVNNTFNSSELEQVLIALPTKMKEQEMIAEKLATIDHLISREKRSLAKLETVKRGVMQDLFTGKVSAKGLLAEQTAVTA